MTKRRFTILYFIHIYIFFSLSLSLSSLYLSLLFDLFIWRFLEMVVPRTPNIFQDLTILVLKQQCFWGDLPWIRTPNILTCYPPSPQLLFRGTCWSGVAGQWERLCPPNLRRVPPPATCLWRSSNPQCHGQLRIQVESHHSLIIVSSCISMVTKGSCLKLFDDLQVNLQVKHRWNIAQRRIFAGHPPADPRNDPANLRRTSPR